MRLRWSERKQDVADVAMALGFVAIVQYEAWTAPIYPDGGDSSPFIQGPRPVVAVCYLVMALALVARRRSPLGTLIVIAFAAAVPTVLFGGNEGWGLVLPFTLALYTVGAHCERRTAMWTGVVVLVLAFLSASRDPTTAGLLDAVFTLPWYSVLVIPWLAGMYVRTRRLYVAGLRERVQLAEREKEERARVAVAEERAQIARELHDAVAHAMSVMVVQAEAGEEVLASEPEKTRVALERIQLTGREGLAEMRRLLGVLRRDEAVALGPQAGLEGVAALLDKVRATGLPVELVVEGAPRPVPTGVDISAYRIVQEALTNVLKHAHAKHVVVAIRYGDELEVEVTDDGIGVSSLNGGGNGLAGMRERVALFGGTLRIGPGPERGLRVRAKIPVEDWT